MKKRYGWLPAIIILFSYSPVFSGTAPAQILEVAPSARVAAMGEAGTSLSEGIDSLYSNPAGLALIERSELSFSSLKLYENSLFHYAAYAYDFQGVRVSNVDDLGALAVSFSFLDWGYRRTDASGAQTGIFSPRDRITQLTYAKPVFSDDSAGSVFFGISAKSVTEEFKSVSSENTCFDAGIIFKHPWRKISAGVSLLNYSNSFSYDREQFDPPQTLYELPRTFKASVSSALMRESLIVGVDYSNKDKSSSGFAVGTEYFPGTKRLFALRAGYNSFNKEAAGLSYGAGLILKNVDVFFFYAQEININYAFVRRGDLGNIHNATFTMKLGAD